MSYKLVMWTVAAVGLVGVITAASFVWEPREVGPVFIASNGPVTEDQIRQKMTADGWSNVLITRQGRYFQVMGSKGQQTNHLTLDSQTGRLRGGEGDDD